MFASEWRCWSFTSLQEQCGDCLRRALPVYCRACTDAVSHSTAAPQGDAGTSIALWPCPQLRTELLMGLERAVKVAPRHPATHPWLFEDLMPSLRQAQSRTRHEDVCSRQGLSASVPQRLTPCVVCSRNGECTTHKMYRAIGAHLTTHFTQLDMIQLPCL